MQGKDDNLTAIHGSHGRGGGRILRRSFALSAIGPKPVAIQHIRVHRENPDFRLQPLKGLETLACDTVAKIEGVRNGSPTAHYAFQKRGERRSEGVHNLRIQPRVEVQCGSEQYSS